MSIQQYTGAPGPSSLQPPSSTTTVPPNPSVYALQYPHPSREAELDAVQALRHTSARSIEGHYHPPGAISLMQQYQANQQAYQWSPGRAQSLALPVHDAPYAHRAKRGREEEDGDVARYPHEEHDATADFTQTFYDPFRIKHRRRTSPAQLKILEHYFAENPKPDVTLRQELSSQLDMTPREVQVWFQNRRAKVKKQLERDERLDEPNESVSLSPDPVSPEPPVYTAQQSTSYDQQGHSGLQLQGAGTGPWRRTSEVEALYYESGGFHTAQHPQYQQPHHYYPSPLSTDVTSLPSPSESSREFQQYDEYGRLVAPVDEGHPSIRFGLHTAGVVHWAPVKEEYGANQRSFGNAMGPPYATPPVNVQSLLANMDLMSPTHSMQSPEFGFQTTIGDGGNDYSPESSSSLDEHHDRTQHLVHLAPHTTGYTPPISGSHHNLSGQSFHQFTFSMPPRSSPAYIELCKSHEESERTSEQKLWQATRFESTMSTQPGTLVNGGLVRRASCPAQMLPQVSNEREGVLEMTEQEDGGRARREQRHYGIQRHPVSAWPPQQYAGLSCSAPASASIRPHSFPPPGTAIANAFPPPSVVPTPSFHSTTGSYGERRPASSLGTISEGNLPSRLPWPSSPEPNQSSSNGIARHNHSRHHSASSIPLLQAAHLDAMDQANARGRPRHGMTGRALVALSSSLPPHF